MYTLSSKIQERIDELVRTHGSATIQSYSQLSQRYRDTTPDFGFKNKAETLAYSAARLPATFAAISHVFSQFPNDFSPYNFLDLGAGPGTGAIAATAFWPTLETLSIVEQDSWMIEISKHLLGDISQTVTYRQADFLKNSASEMADLVLLSYVVNEWPLEDQIRLIENAWKATTQALVVIVPGTPQHYQNLMKIRQWLTEQGGFIWAPCPHQRACPLKSPDWCHFSERLPRSSHHRRLKGGVLPYEDEKFSYLIVGKQPISITEARIIRYPMIRSGHIVLDLCEKDGLSRKTISKKDKALYGKAKKSSWGDVWE